MAEADLSESADRRWRDYLTLPAEVSDDDRGSFLDRWRTLADMLDQLTWDAVQYQKITAARAEAQRDLVAAWGR